MTASIATCTLIFFVVIIPVVLFVTILSREAFDLYIMARDAVISQQLKQLLAETRALDKINMLMASAGFESKLSWDDLIRPISDVGKLVGFSLFEQARFITSNVLSLVLYFCLMLIVVFYMFIDGDRCIKYMYDLSPLPDEHDKKLFNKFKDMAGAVLIGNGLGGLIQGVAGGLLFFFLGINSPFLWAVIMGFLAFLPIVGIGLVLIPAACVMFLTDRFVAAVGVIVFYGALSWGVEYIFKPKVVGNRVRMHPLLVFFAIVGGLKVFGLMGIIYGPLILTFFLTLADIYFTSYQFLIEPGKGLKPNNKNLEQNH